MEQKKGNIKLKSTCLAFDTKKREDKKCYEVLLSLGSYAKLFVKTALYAKYSGMVNIRRSENKRPSINVIGDDLYKMVEKYKKPYEKSASSDVIYLNWRKCDDTDMACLNILMPFQGGIKDFIIYVLYDSYPFLFDDDAHLPVYVKKTRSSGNVSNKPVITEEHANKPENIGNKDSPAMEIVHEVTGKDPEPEIPPDEELELMDIITKGFDA